MIVIAFIAFFALVVAWLVAPTSEPKPLTTAETPKIATNEAPA